MSLINSNTKWVLFLSASNNPEDRHILDLAFGLYTLQNAGVAINNIYIYIDGKNRPWINSLMANGSSSAFTVRETKDFFLEQKSNTHENLVMFVTGHGNIDGIDATPPIKPYDLLRSIKSSPNLKQAIIYLGQCYAGIFNYIAAGRNPSTPGANDPEVILIGATNLHESLSSSTQEQFAGGALSWFANLYLLHVFRWIRNPFDVDGDGKFTIADSYKYAGVNSNGANKGIKAQAFVNSIGYHEKWLAAEKAHTAAPTAQNKLTFDAIQSQYVSELGILYNHQECWILNSIPAQNIEI
jgi:hypothetical protein